MALIIEDGSEVLGANSYVTDTDYIAYAALQGLTIGADAPAREIELLKGVNFIESHRDQFKGRKITKEQSLQWPRTGVWIDSFRVDSDEIPAELKNAQFEAGVAENKLSLLKTEDKSNVSKVKVDVIEKEFFTGGDWAIARTERIDVFLNQLLRNSSSFVAQVIRA